MNDPEIQDKLHRLGQFLERHRLDAVLLNQRANFAWITGGRSNYIPNNSPFGVASILATGHSRTCFTNSIERARFGDEELAGTGIDVVDYLWHDRQAGQKALAELLGGRRVAADTGGIDRLDLAAAGIVPLPAEFDRLRWQLSEAEMDRYREGGRRTAAAIEAACRRFRPGDSEHAAAGALDDEVRRRGLIPVVTLVAADARLADFRHPIPTDQPIGRQVMLVTCASWGGLISNVTRMVHFGSVPADLARKYQAVVNVDAAANLSTAPGRTLSQMFSILATAYADNGFPGQCDHHHQGGSTGYAGRDQFATPDSDVVVLDRQAFAWNPSVPGAKSEDTVLCRAGRAIEILTAASADWPAITARFGEQTIQRAGILVR